MSWQQETLLLEWINPIYLDIAYQEKIQEEFEDSSEIQLKDFLKVKLKMSFFLLFFSQDFFNTLCPSTGGKI